jgi:hypothetical protein
VTTDQRKETDDVAGAATAAETADEPEHLSSETDGAPAEGVADPPPAVAELAAACVRFVASRYGVMLDFTSDTLSLVDQWIRDARAEVTSRPETEGLIVSAAGAYLGEVVRRRFGGEWFAEGDYAGWRLYLSTVYLAYNPIGMVREALILGPAEGWHSHFELDPGEREAIEARLAALPAVDDEEYYAPTTRFDVVSIVFEALRDGLRARGLSDVRFTPDDYES